MPKITYEDLDPNIVEMLQKLQDQISEFDVRISAVEDDVDQHEETLDEFEEQITARIEALENANHHYAWAAAA